MSLFFRGVWVLVSGGYSRFEVVRWWFVVYHVHMFFLFGLFFFFFWFWLRFWFFCSFNSFTSPSPSTSSISITYHQLFKQPAILLTVRAAWTIRRATKREISGALFRTLNESDHPRTLDSFRSQQTPWWSWPYNLVSLRHSVLECGRMVPKITKKRIWKIPRFSMPDPCFLTPFWRLGNFVAASSVGVDEA